MQLCDPGRREERAIVIKARVTRVTTPLIVVKVRMIVIPATLIVVKARVTVITTPLIVIKVRVTVITATLIVIKARVTVITTPVIVIKVRVTVITTPVIVVKVRVTVITTPVIVIKVRVTVITALVIVVKVRVTVITTRVTVIKGLGTVITRSDSYLARRDTGLASATVIFAARKRSRTRLAKSRSDRDAVAGWVALLAPLVAAPQNFRLEVIQFGRRPAKRWHASFRMPASQDCNMVLRKQSRKVMKISTLPSRVRSPSPALLINKLQAI